jgi:hypothetical protein
LSVRNIPAHSRLPFERILNQKIVEVASVKWPRAILAAGDEVVAWGSRDEGAVNGSNGEAASCGC